jgi:hypothetical protein
VGVIFIMVDEMVPFPGKSNGYDKDFDYINVKIS